MGVLTRDTNLRGEARHTRKPVPKDRRESKHDAPKMKILTAVDQSTARQCFVDSPSAGSKEFVRGQTENACAPSTSLPDPCGDRRRLREDATTLLPTVPSVAPTSSSTSTTGMSSKQSYGASRLRLDFHPNQLHPTSGIGGVHPGTRSQSDPYALLENRTQTTQAKPYLPGSRPRSPHHRNRRIPCGCVKKPIRASA